MPLQHQLAKSIRIGSLNCRGLNNYYKRMAVFDFLRNSNLAIIFLQETKLKPEEEGQYIKEWHNHNCIFNSTVGGKSGTAILINVDYISILHNRLRDVEGKVIAIDVSVQGDIFHLVNSYGPNDHELKVPFINRLYLYLSSNKPIIWAGDHNIATNPSLDRYPVRFSHDQGGREILDLTNTFDLQDACRVLYPDKNIYTFRKGPSRSRIDKICVSCDFVIEKYEQLHTSYSDHELISSHLRYSPSWNLGPGVWRNNTKYYSDPDFLQQFQVFWEYSKNNIERSGNLQKWWQDFKYFFKLKSIHFAKEKALFEKREFQMREQGLYNLTLLLNRNPNSRHLLNHYSILKKTILEARIKSIKEKLFKDDAKYLMHGDKPTKSFFDKYKNKSEHKYIRTLKNDQGEKVKDIDGILKVAEKFYRELFSGKILLFDNQQWIFFWIILNRKSQLGIY